MTSFRQPPVAKAQMLIRRPVAEVYNAFIDPAVTCRFWFTKSSGKLEVGKRVRWEWEMYGVGDDVTVKALDPNRRILIQWSSEGGPTTVEWMFTPRSPTETFVEITNAGFQGDGDSVVAQALDATGGFNIVLCGLKAVLEHGIELGLIGDKAPDFDGTAPLA